MSSTERVRAFRARNPGYDRRWKRGRGKASHALLAAQYAAQQASLQAPQAQPIAGSAASETVLSEAAPEPLPHGHGSLSEVVEVKALPEAA